MADGTGTRNNKVIPRRGREPVVEVGLTNGSTGARAAEFLWFLQCVCPGRVNSSIKCTRNALELQERDRLLYTKEMK
jgi:hypothetical protein